MNWINRQSVYQMEETLENEIVESCYKRPNRAINHNWAVEVLGRNTEEEKVVEYLHF